MSNKVSDGRQVIIYYIETNTGTFLNCWDRNAGDSHYTFSVTAEEYMASTFDFRRPAEDALKAYLLENKGSTAVIKTKPKYV